MNLEYILKCFPVNIRQAIEEKTELNNLEEIRLRNNLPIILELGKYEKVIQYKINPEEMNYIFQKICENSIYTYQNQIASGLLQ